MPPRGHPARDAVRRLSVVNPGPIHRFAGRRSRDVENATLPEDFFLRTDVRRSRSIDTGNPDPAYDDVDGTRNDVGFTGGPLAGYGN